MDTLYSQFCARYRAWKGKLDVTMRQSHVAGEKMFVDYAGATAEVIDPESGEVHEAQIFGFCRKIFLFSDLQPIDISAASFNASIGAYYGG